MMMSPPATIISIAIAIPISIREVIILRVNSAVGLYGHDFDKVVSGVHEFSDV